MPINLSDLQRASPPPPPDADRLTRSRAATRVMDDLRPFFTWLRSTIWFATGIIQGLDPDATEAECEDAAERVTRYLARRWRVRDPRVRCELARRASVEGASWGQVKRDTLRSAVWDTFRGDVNKPQTLRFRPEGWLVDEAGHKLVVAPGALPLALADRWAYSRAMKLAAADTLDLTLDAYEHARACSAGFPRRSGNAPIVRADDVDRDADPAYLLLERETAQDIDAQYADVLRVATPAQRRLLAAWLVQIDAGASLAGVARAIGMSERTAYVQLSRLRATLRARGFLE